MLHYTENSSCVNKYAATIYSPTAPEHSHSYFEIAFAKKGISTHTINGTSTVFSRGVCTIIRPCDKHFFSGNFDNPKNYQHTDLYFPVDRFKQICDSMNSTLYENIIQSKKDISFSVSNDFLSFTEPLINLLINNTLSAEILDTLHFSTLCAVLTSYIKSTSVNNSLYPTWLNDFLFDLNNPQTMTMKLSDLAKKYGYSAEHLSRKFKEYTNEKLVDYITKQKINYAITLLTPQTMSILDISNVLGYQKQSTFTENFKKIQGCTPMEFIKKLKQ